MDKATCSHCSRPVYALRSRGLCDRCYVVRAIRVQYPLLRPGFDWRSSAGIHERAGLPEPTSAPPGSEAKIAVMAARAERNESLWHPLDGPVE